jgi:hypothetical protein
MGLWAVTKSADNLHISPLVSEFFIGPLLLGCLLCGATLVLWPVSGSLSKAM